MRNIRRSASTYSVTLYMPHGNNSPYHFPLYKICVLLYPYIVNYSRKYFIIICKLSINSSMCSIYVVSL